MKFAVPGSRTSGRVCPLFQRLPILLPEFNKKERRPQPSVNIIARFFFFTLSSRMGAKDLRNYSIALSLSNVSIFNPGLGALSGKQDHLVQFVTRVPVIVPLN